MRFHLFEMLTSSHAHCPVVSKSRPITSDQLYHSPRRQSLDYRKLASFAIRIESCLARAVLSRILHCVHHIFKGHPMAAAPDTDRSELLSGEQRGLQEGRVLA